MSDLIVGVGVALALEGTLYAIAPQVMRKLMRAGLDVSVDALRLGGVAALAVGVGVVWLIRAA